MANPVAEMMSHKGSMGEMDGEGEDYTASDEYGAHVSQLKSALGLDDVKAAQLAEAICGIVRAEEAKGDSGEKPSAPPPGKGGVALVIGMGRSKK